MIVVMARCQCDPKCKMPPEKGSAFCKNHKRYCTRRAPVSKYTPMYKPWRYNKYKGVQGTLNCYAYAMDYLKIPKSCTLDECNKSYVQPGRASGYPEWSDIKGKRCPDVISRILGDIPKSYMTTFEEKCKGRTRKTALVTDPKNDYHFYRQDRDGMWSHKPGATKVTRLDTTGRPIYDPQLAARDNKKSNLNYNRFCSYMCVPVDKEQINLKRGGYKRRTCKRKRTI